jgi:hypothetical protein
MNFNVIANENTFSPPGGFDLADLDNFGKGSLTQVFFQRIQVFFQRIFRYFSESLFALSLSQERESSSNVFEFENRYFISRNHPHLPNVLLHCRSSDCVFIPKLGEEEKRFFIHSQFHYFSSSFFNPFVSNHP